jgi:adenylosuccinate synthase
MLNGVTELHLMKADILDGFTEIQACTHYRTVTGESTPQLPDPGELTTVTPEYITLPGWNSDLTTLTDAAQLPPNLVAYLEFLEKELQVPISIVSVGPDRVSTLFR